MNAKSKVTVVPRAVRVLNVSGSSHNHDGTYRAIATLITYLDTDFSDQDLLTTNSPTFQNVVLGATKSLFFGPYDENDTWRIVRDGNNLVIQRREAGSYVTKSTITP